MSDIPIYTISSKRMFDTCPAKYEYRILKELDSLTLSEALNRGTLFHEQAEEAHSPDRINIEQRGYALWVASQEELTPIRTEFVTESNINLLQKYVGAIYPKPPRGKFAGVIDLLAVQKDNTRGIVDHKSTSRFYNFPYLYSTEQLYMYYLSCLMAGEDLSWVCLSRVKVEEDTPYAKARNYMVSYLKRTVGEEVTAKFLVDLTKRSGYDIIKYLSTNVNVNVIRKIQNTKEQNTQNIKIHNTLNVSTSNSTTFDMAPSGPKDSPKRVVISLNSAGPASNQRAGQIKNITIRNDRGYIISSLLYTQNTLIHVERAYFTPSQEELQRVARDFITYVRDVQGTKEFRRAPGLHCTQCPFQGVCEDERRMPVEAPRMTQDEILALYPTLGITRPNQEVLRALEKESQISPKLPIKFSKPSHKRTLTAARKHGTIREWRAR